MTFFPKSRRVFLKQLGLQLGAGLAWFAAGTTFVLSRKLQPQAAAGPGKKPNPETKVCYLNTGTLGISPPAVLEAQTRVLAEMENDFIKSQDHEFYSQKSRARLAQFFGVSSDEIALTHNTTEGINIVAWGLPLQKGDEVILTTHEHVGNALPWLNRARTEGLQIRSFTPQPTAQETLAVLEALITPRTRVLALPHITCTTGTILPIQEIALLARARGIFLMVDGAQSVGAIPLHFQELGVDFYAGCGHKWLLGPKGTGFLFVRRELLETLQAKWIGAYSDTGWEIAETRAEITGLAPSAHRYDYGTQNQALQAGLIAALDWIDNEGIDSVAQHGKKLAGFLQHELFLRKDSIEVLTPSESRSRGSMMSFRFRNSAHNFKRFSQFAIQKKYRVRVVPEAKLNAIRVSTHLYNTQAEVAGFLEVVDTFISAPNDASTNRQNSSAIDAS